MAKVRKLSEEEAAAGRGGGGLRLGDHKGNYLHQLAESSIKPKSTAQWW